MISGRGLPWVTDPLSSSSFLWQLSMTRVSEERKQVECCTLKRFWFHLQGHQEFHSCSVGHQNPLGRMEQYCRRKLYMTLLTVSTRLKGQCKNRVDFRKSHSLFIPVEVNLEQGYHIRTVNIQVTIGRNQKINISLSLCCHLMLIQTFQPRYGSHVMKGFS